MTPLRLSLVVPHGVEPAIFPWGASLIRDYVRHHVENAHVELLNFSADQELRELFEAHQSLLEIRDRMTSRAHQIFVGNAPYKDTFLGLVATLGGRFFEIADRHGMFRQSQLGDRAERLDQVQRFSRAFDELMSRRIAAEKSAADGCLHVVGFSTYDHTVFNTIGLADRFRRESNPDLLLVGGDYWDFRNAPKTLAALPFIDAVVVGYGEQSLVEIMAALRSGRHVGELNIKGVVTRARNTEATPLPPDQGEAPIFIRPRDLRVENRTWTFNVPDAYTAKSQGSPFRLVHRDLHHQNHYRILTQRGCSFGGCRFCTQIDKMLHFEFGIDEVWRQVVEQLESDNPEQPVGFTIDNDEMTSPDLIFLLKQIDSLPYQVNSVTFFYQVKLFTPEIAKTLSELQNPGRFSFVMNWESLNPQTLKNMTKGHYPLDGIQAAKAVLDCGAAIATNYMVHFPLQGPDDIEIEADLLEKSLHLLTHPNASPALFPYAANGRDTISGKPEKFNITVKRNPYNVWMVEAYGADLDISFWQYEYFENLAWKSERVLARLFHESRKSPSPLGRALRSWMFTATAMASRKPAYQRRMQLFEYISRATYRKHQSPLPRSSFFIEGTSLHRHFRAWRNGEQWSRSLSRDELLVLRALYFSQSQKDLIQQLKREMHEGKTLQIVSDHLALGTLVEQRGKLLCVANDPGYWREGSASERRKSANLRSSAVSAA